MQLHLFVIKSDILHREVAYLHPLGLDENAVIRLAFEVSFAFHAVENSLNKSQPKGGEAHLRPIILAHWLIVLDANPDALRETRWTNEAHSTTLVQALFLRLHFTSRTDFDILRHLLCVFVFLLRKAADLMLLLVCQHSICVTCSQHNSRGQFRT